MMLRGSSVARLAAFGRGGALQSQARKIHSKPPNAAYTLVLIRHGESTWNKENRFTGWCDVPLSEKGTKEAQEGGRLLKEAGYKFDKAYTSVLRRAIKTCLIVLEEMDLLWIPVTKAWELNERHYGALQGLDKTETVKRHGPEMVHVWRRSYDIPPPPLDKGSPYYPGNEPKYAGFKKTEWPLTESLKTTLDRVMPYWNLEMVPQVKGGKNILVAAHGNSLRALVKKLDNISEDVIADLNIPTAVPLVYHLDRDLRPIKHPLSIDPLSGYYLGDQEAIRARIEGVKNQTKAK